MGYHVTIDEIHRAEGELRQAIAIVMAVPKKDDFDKGNLQGLARGESALQSIYARSLTTTSGGVRFARADVEQAIQQVLPSPVARPGCERSYDRGVGAGLVQSSIILHRILERARMRWVRGHRGGTNDR